MFSRILWGLVLIAASFAIIKFRRSIYDFTGSIDFLDKYCGDTVNGIALFGILIFIGAIMYMTGGLDLFLSGFSQYFGGGSEVNKTP